MRTVLKSRSIRKLRIANLDTKISFLGKERICKFEGAEEETLGFITSLFYFYFLCMSLLPACMSVQHVHIW